MGLFLKCKLLVYTEGFSNQSKLLECLPTPQIHRFVNKSLSSFQSAVSRNAMQYSGSSQHDAQEFLLWLLDRVHEDLNNIVQSNSGPSIKVKKKYICVYEFYTEMLQDM